MDFYEILDQVVELLQQRRRVTYQALKRQFQLDDAYLEDLKAELIAAQQLAADESGKVLVWTGNSPPVFSPAAVPAAPPPPTPLAYTPHHLTEKVLASRAALEGERKQVTVLFADLKGSMELLADRDPEEARQLLDPVLERMMAAVHRYEGTVNQVLGDGIMALFGAPIAHEDHAVRACYAALRMQEAVGQYAEELRRHQGLDVQIRVGLNSGDVVVRSIGNDLHMDYTAVGQTTHLAARMEQLARPGTTLITTDTLRLVEGYFEVKPLGPVPVKGLTEPIEIYEVLRAGWVRTRLQAAAARGLTRFIGREAEMDQLRQAMERADAGHGQVVALVGEPGVGKSRLFWEFIPEAALQRGLAHLQAAEFLYETRLFPEPEYTFKHALTHGVAYGSLLLERRRVLHACLVEALEALAPERVAEQVERLAHHAVRGELWGKAVTCCQQAGARAYDRAAFREAVVYFEQARELAAVLGKSALQVQASHTLGQAYYAIGDFNEAAELLRRNVEAADREPGTPRTVFRIESRAWLALTLSDLGAFAEGRRHGEEALRLATIEGRGDTPIIVHGCLGHLYLAQGDLAHAIRVLEQGLALCRASGNRDWLRAIVAGLGYAYTIQGRLAEGSALLEEAIRESMRTGARQSHLWVPWLSEVCRLAGHGEEAWQHARQALDLARQLKERANEALALRHLGVVHAHADPPDAEQAEAHYRQALPLAEELGMRPLQSHCHLGLGTLYATTGQREQARTALTTAIDLYRAMEMTFWLPQAEAALAQVE